MLGSEPLRSWRSGIQGNRGDETSYCDDDADDSWMDLSDVGDVGTFGDVQGMSPVPAVTSIPARKSRFCISDAFRSAAAHSPIPSRQLRHPDCNAPCSFRQPSPPLRSRT